MNPFFLQRDLAGLVVIDVQERLLPAMPAPVVERFLRYQKALIDGFRTLGRPILATEQYVKGLGPTTEPIAAALGETERLEKMTFSCWREEPFPARLAATGCKQLVVCGIETHVCVLQTALDLLAEGYVVHIPADAVGSRTEENRHNGLELARQAGAVITNTETALFQLLDRADIPEFKPIAKMIK